MTRSGEVVCWGDSRNNECEVPVEAHDVISIGAGYFHRAAVTRGGDVVYWGDRSNGRCDVPSEFAGILASVCFVELFTLAATCEGKVVGWGTSQSHLNNIPEGLVVAGSLVLM
jgi:hypothetical protein